MRKNFIAITLFISLIFLTACQTKQVHLSIEGVNDEHTKGLKVGTTNVNEVVVDNTKYKITLLTINTTYNDNDGHTLKVKYEIQNKGEESITIQAKDLFADGSIIRDELVHLSQDITSNATAHAELAVIEAYPYFFPDPREELDMSLVISTITDTSTPDVIPITIRIV